MERVAVIKGIEVNLAEYTQPKRTNQIKTWGVLRDNVINNTTAFMSFETCSDQNVSPEWYSSMVVSAMTKLWYYISGNDIFREFTLWTRSKPGESRKTISDSGSRRWLRRWTSYQIHKIAGWARFPRHWLQRKPLVSDPGMHHGTCVTHVPWWSQDR